MMVDLWGLKKGDRLRLESGIIAVVTAKTLDGEWVKIRYIAAPDSPQLEGTEDLCSGDEIVRLEQSK